MPEDYNELKNDFSKELGTIEAKIKEAESEGSEFPSYLTDALTLAKSQYEEAEKKFSDGNKEEAFSEMQVAVNSVHAVLNDVYEFYFEKHYQKACEVHASFEGHEDLADGYIPNFGKHSKEFSKIASFIESYKSSNEKPPRNNFLVGTYLLQEFFKDFEKGKEALFAAIKKAEKVSQTAQDTLQLKQKSVELEEETVRLRKETVRQGNEIIQLKKNQSWIRILSVGAAVISAFVGIKSCVSDTSFWQVAQPEANASEAEITS